MSTNRRKTIQELRSALDTSTLSPQLELRLKGLETAHSEGPSRLYRRRNRWTTAIGVAASVAALAIVSTVLFQSGKSDDVPQPRAAASQGVKISNSNKHSGSNRVSELRSVPLSGSVVPSCNKVWEAPGASAEVGVSVDWPARMSSKSSTSVTTRLRNNTGVDLRSTLLPEYVFQDEDGVVVAITSDTQLTVTDVTVLEPGVDVTKEFRAPIVGTCDPDGSVGLANGTYTVTMIVSLPGGLLASTSAAQMEVAGA